MNAESPSDSAVSGPDKVRAAMGAMLRGAQLNFTDAQLEALSGVPARAIKGYRLEEHEPSLGNALALAKVLGTPAVNYLLSTLIQHVGARPADDSDKLDIPEVVAVVARELATLASAAADGRVDHLEEPAVRAASNKIIEAVLPYSDAGRA